MPSLLLKRKLTDWVLGHKRRSLTSAPMRCINLFNGYQFIVMFCLFMFEAPSGGNLVLRLRGLCDTLLVACQPRISASAGCDDPCAHGSRDADTTSAQLVEALEYK